MLLLSFFFETCLSLILKFPVSLHSQCETNNDTEEVHGIFPWNLIEVWERFPLGRLVFVVIKKRGWVHSCGMYGAYGKIYHFVFRWSCPMLNNIFLESKLPCFRAGMGNYGPIMICGLQFPEFLNQHGWLRNSRS